MRLSFAQEQVLRILREGYQVRYHPRYGWQYVNRDGLVMSGRPRGSTVRALLRLGVLEQSSRNGSTWYALTRESRT